MTDLNVQDLIQKISEAIEFLEDRQKIINKNIPIYSDDEKTSFSESWLSKIWQVNMDIDRLKGLLYDCQYNPQVISDEGVRQLFAWLYKKYDIDMRK